ncbi:lipoate--protein ligase family protein [Alkalicoccobacillus murimartini]|uniref:Octanoyl-[GcvH]:protein N-octanoyltransferase n=1 Tax=Alkalicoccobacillus murimartini TaxID=171685 RepID=A0ABT9YGX3_9BACI|nr:lipoate--protein ligase family protein [Alkalicoccobacillus murimartini]MDQ0207092.1 octanoyl-[GcvH]:protein N-octanoyltransferase [Alkalicoccobacillus murimartini]
MISKQTNQKFAKQWRYFDHTERGPEYDALQSFAFDDMLCQTVGETGSAAFRAWVHHHTVVLGTQDSRLPFIHDGLHFLAPHYRAVVRNSGGLAVMLDEGVLNLSLIFKESKGWSINAGYDLMVELIRSMFSNHREQIEAREIIGSYCPGSYDLSIDGRKFAGISQRRTRGGVAVQIYLCVTGSGEARAEVIRNFYEVALRDGEARYDVPTIRPEVMASLEELIGEELTVKSVLERAFEAMEQLGAVISPSEANEEEQNLFEQQLIRVTQRHDRCLE